jgi:hypothetical protein
MNDDMPEQAATHDPGSASGALVSSRILVRLGLTKSTGKHSALARSGAAP